MLQQRASRSGRNFAGSNWTAREGQSRPTRLQPTPTSNRHTLKDTRGQPDDNLPMKPATRKALLILAAGATILIAASLGSGVIMTISMLLLGPE